jgi:4'-phosphopantetheinyl transferase EntD
MMSVGADSQPYSSIVAVRPGFRMADAPHTAECVSALDLGLRSSGAHITLVALHQSQLEDCASSLMEANALRGNVAEKRRNEFLLGRAAARLALIGAGMPNPSPVKQRAGRDPDWPAGIVGSITHCAPWAVAAVSKSESLRSIGIDLEDVEAVPVEEIVELVSTDTECKWILRGPNSKLKLASLFSAKEAAYKAIFPLCRRFFDFHAMELVWFHKFNSFHGVLCEELSPDFPLGYRFEIGCQRSANFVFMHTIIPR